MAISLQTDAGLVIIPDGYSQVKVISSPAGLAANGIVAIIGEADAGPDFSDENPDGTGNESLEDNAFGPDQIGDVIAKYRSGQLVDAFRELAGAANDPQLPGAFQRCIIVKTNVGGKAEGVLEGLLADYGDLADRSTGALGNLINFQVSADTSEVVPTTGEFTMLTSQLATDIEFRINGGAAVAYSMGANEKPNTFVTNVAALSGVIATGGTNRAIIAAVAGTLALAVVSGVNVTITHSGTWATNPSVGDSLWISAASCISGGADQNSGSYVVTAVTSSVISATKLLDNTGTQGVCTSPVNVAAASIASTTADCQAFAPVTISLEAGDPIDGIGKSLEIAEVTSSGKFSDLAYDLNDEAVSWVSTSDSPANVYSSVEYRPNLAVSRQLDGLSDNIIAGGGVVMTLGYAGTTAACEVTFNETTGKAALLTIDVTGGSGSDQSITLANYPTIADLVAFLNSKTGFTAAVGTAPAAGSQASTSLDATTFDAGSKHGAKNARLKQDAHKFAARVAGSFVQLNDPEMRAAAGVPWTTSSTFMEGGSRGATTDALVTSALAALENCVCNFVVPLFANDAEDDIADGTTDDASSYTVAGVHAATRTHVLAVSTLKRKKNRQGFLGFRGSFTDGKAQASGLASPRLACCLQDARTPDSTGTVVQQRPWMLAVKAAGMQAAGFYRSIMRKGINVTGVIQAAGDFNPSNDSQLEDALLSGCLIAKRDPTGVIYWVSDQTTYAKDDNFVWNSIQAVYASDVLSLSAAQRMANAAIGQSVADFGKVEANMVMESFFAQMLSLKILAPSDDAPKGYKNLVIRVRGPVIEVAAEVKLATAISFVNIVFSISQVTQG